MGNRFFFRLCFTASVLTLIVVLLGAWVRLEDAGLGCPDWPGCYGMLLGVPNTDAAVEAANEAYPDRPVHAGKAWKEMIHRYVAGALGLVVFAIAAIAVRRRRQPGQPVALPVFLAGLIVAQAVLGMWTVTWQLKPLVVTLHLLGGMATLALLWWLSLRAGRLFRPATEPGARRMQPWVLIVVAVVAVQIALGGWVSTNYAALACTDFPRCGGSWWPADANFADGFVLWQGLGVDYEFGVLDHPARVAVQFVHRLGAAMTALAVIALAVAVWSRIRSPVPRRAAAVVVAVLVVQWLLGITNVLASLPLPVAVAHNGGAALLLLSLLTLCHTLRSHDSGQDGDAAGRGIPS